MIRNATTRMWNSQNAASISGSPIATSLPTMASLRSGRIWAYVLAPALVSLVSNEANMTIQGATQSMPYVVNGQMRGIAVTGPRRFPNLPNLPAWFFCCLQSVSHTFLVSPRHKYATN